MQLGISPTCAGNLDEVRSENWFDPEMSGNRIHCGAHGHGGLTDLPVVGGKPAIRFTAPSGLVPLRRIKMSGFLI